MKSIHEARQKNSAFRTPFQDDYQFDLGYHQSYVLVVFLNCLLFSALVPIIPFFAFIFFSIKYQVDKYNLIFVYFKVYESGGKIRKNVTSFMIFNLVLYLIIMVSFFSLKFSSMYLWGGSIMIVTWCIIYYYTKQQLMAEFDLD